MVVPAKAEQPLGYSMYLSFFLPRASLRMDKVVSLAAFIFNGQEELVNYSSSRMGRSSQEADFFFTVSALATYANRNLMDTSDGVDTATNDSGQCKVHTSIQIKRLNRNGDWVCVMKACPLCSACDGNSPKTSSRLTTPSMFRKPKDDELPSRSPTNVNNWAMRSPYAGFDQTPLTGKFASAMFPPLPLTMQATESTTISQPVIANMHLQEKQMARLSRLHQQVLDRKEIMRELKIRSLVLPSQRYAGSDVDCRIQTTEVKHSSSNMASNCESASTFYSEASYYSGKLNKEICTSTFHSDGKLTNDNVPCDDEYSRPSMILIIPKSMEASFDSFIEPTCHSMGLRGNSLDHSANTLRAGNTTLNKCNANNDAKNELETETASESIVNGSIFQSASNFDESTRNIWEGVSDDRSISGEVYPAGGKENGAKLTKDDASKSGGRIVKVSTGRRPQQDATRQIDVNDEVCNVDRKLQSLRSNCRMWETVGVEDASGEELSCFEHDCDDQFGVSGLWGEVPLERSFLNSDCHNSANQSRPDPPDLTMLSSSEESVDSSSCFSYGLREGLRDYQMAFDTIRPMRHEKEKEALHDFERKEADLMLALMKRCNPCSFSTTKFSGSTDRKTSNSGTRSKSFDSSKNERNSPRSVNSQTSMQQASTDASMNKSCNSSVSSDSSAGSTISLASSSSSVRIDGYEIKRSFANCHSEGRCVNHPHIQLKSPCALTNKSSNGSDSTASSAGNTISLASSSSSVRTDSPQESKRSFANSDSQGRCIYHPHIQLKRKRAFGGLKNGNWKTVMTNCTQCCFEEVQRLRKKNLRERERMKSDNTDATSLSLSSSLSDNSSGFYVAVCTEDDSGNISSTVESGLTSTFSFMSSSFISTCSPLTAGPSIQSQHPGILRLPSLRGSNLTPESKTCQGSWGRVVFAGRDDIMNC